MHRTNDVPAPTAPAPQQNQQQAHDNNDADRADRDPDLPPNSQAGTLRSIIL